MDSLKRWLDAEPTRTQTALANDLKVSAPTVNDYVHGNCNPSSKRLHLMHQVTEIPLEVLIEDCARDAQRRKKAAA